jgi:hypothetical protein
MIILVIRIITKSYININHLMKKIIYKKIVVYLYLQKKEKNEEDRIKKKKKKLQKIL